MEELRAPCRLVLRVDETYIKVKGQWRYLYRAVDKQGQAVDFLLSKNRDRAAAVRFFKKRSAITRSRRRSRSTAVRRPIKPAPN